VNLTLIIVSVNQKLAENTNISQLETSCF